MAPVTPSAFRVPGAVWAGWGVLAVGLGASVAMASGFGQSMACGTFGLDCVAMAFGMLLFTLCVTLVLLLRGWNAMRRHGAQGGAWAWLVMVLTAGTAGVVALAILFLLGFVVLVVVR
ncbi:hypothetical protein [Acidovorax sp. Leaf78]|uniref:hypothetical protein n=1 Tax=Acidovorax sp. Leaf78 TaxID=1736237 RepID=UPI000AC14A56|nr:hypothetical protein [Acidovorax sp. Leaf78]